MKPNRSLNITYTSHINLVFIRLFSKMINTLIKLLLVGFVKRNGFISWQVSKSYIKGSYSNFVFWKPSIFLIRIWYYLIIQLLTVYIKYYLVYLVVVGLYFI